MIELETSPWRDKAQHKVDSEGLSAEEKDYPVVSKGKKKGPSEASLKSDYRLGHQEIVKLSFPFFLYRRMGDSNYPTRSTQWSLPTSYRA